MHVEHNYDNTLAGTLLTVIIALITFTEVELALKGLAAVAAIAASGTTIYYTVKNNRKKNGNN